MRRHTNVVAWHSRWGYLCFAWTPSVESWIGTDGYYLLLITIIYYLKIFIKFIHTHPLFNCLTYFHVQDGIWHRVYHQHQY